MACLYFDAPLNNPVESLFIRLFSDYLILCNRLLECGVEYMKNFDMLMMDRCVWWRCVFHHTHHHYNNQTPDITIAMSSELLST